jgi:hypothetical protein
MLNKVTSSINKAAYKKGSTAKTAVSKATIPRLEGRKNQ